MKPLDECVEDNKKLIEGCVYTICNLILFATLIAVAKAIDSQEIIQRPVSRSRENQRH